MEKVLRLKVDTRERTGSKAAVKVRQQGRVPAVLYGHKQEPVAISLDAHDFVEGLHHGHRLMDLQIGKKLQKAIVKDLQYDYLGKDIIHADLVRVDATETVKVTVPIELRGAARGAEHGGIVEEHADHVEVECKVTDIPESIVVPVKQIEVGDVLHARDIELPALRFALSGSAAARQQPRGSPAELGLRSRAPTCASLLPAGSVPP